MSEEEIKCIEQMKPMMMPIYFFSGSCTNMPYESYSTMGDIKYNLMDKLKLKQNRMDYFALYEVLDKGDSTEERIMEEEELNVNMKAMWAYDTDRFQKKTHSATLKFI
jgi:hypothetical protein